MKLRLIFILFFLINNNTSLLFAQEFNYKYHHLRLKYLHYQNDSGEKGKTTFLYNAEGKLHKAIWELLDGSRHSVNTLILNNNGQLERNSRIFSDSITSELVYTYNENTQLIKEEFTRSDSISGIAEYIYENNRLSKINCRGLKGWFHGTIEYEYNESGLKTGARLLKDEAELGTINYYYGENGLLLEEIWTIKGWTQNFSYEYEDINCKKYVYSSPFISPACGYRVKIEQYTWCGKIGGPSYYHYNDREQLEKKVFIRSDSVQLDIYYQYSDEGLIEKSWRSFDDGSKTIFYYTYNKTGQILSRRFQKTDESTGEELYDYDENGRIKSVQYNNFDGWLNAKATIYYDLYDRPVKADLFGQKVKDGTIDFSYDNFGNMIFMHWQITPEIFQDYSFEYESF